MGSASHTSSAPELTRGGNTAEHGPALGLLPDEPLQKALMLSSFALVLVDAEGKKNCICIHTSIIPSLQQQREKVNANRCQPPADLPC